MAKSALRLCLLVVSILLSFFAFCETKALHIRDARSYVRNLKGNSEGGTLFRPWDKNEFRCPSKFGTFSNPDDCSTYFVCSGGKSNKKSCKRGTAFDKYHKKCLSIFIAVCDKTGGTTARPGTTTTKDIGTATSKDTFTCPSVFGLFMHPTDCSKYYACVIFIPTLKLCPDNELFDGVKLLCRAAKEVNCGSRIKPTEPSIITSEPTTPTPEPTTPTPEPTTPTPEPTTPTPEPTTPTPEPTTPTPEPTTPTPEPTTPTPEPTTPTPEPTTKPTGPPETDCDEDDLDCIIDDTGVTPDWFTCPEDIGSYPHPSSKKLFIFCINWKPSVKKCGQDLVYSNELRTCVDP